MNAQLSTPIDIDPIDALRVASAYLEDVWFLDSAIGDPDRGNRSLLILSGRVVIEGHSDRLVIYSASGNPATIEPSPAGWRALDRAYATLRRRGKGIGWVGWCAYEMGALSDPGIPAHDWDLPFPPLRFVEAELVLEWVDGKGRIVGGADSDALVATWVKRFDDARSSGADHLSQSVDEPVLELLEAPPMEEHASNVLEIIEAIRSGRVYQACYTFPIWFARPQSTLSSYLALRSISPGDYSAWVRNADVEFASTSPERFISVRDGKVRARPMKGTRRRLPGRDEDTIVELSMSEKDRAENVMIVDLLRNDLGRVCEIGSVSVPELFTVETYETVHQMTSTVEGTLAEGVGPFRLLQATFPPGSMTGAPKVEACKLLNELEPQPRGLYAGTLGWVGYDGEWAFNVVIRTLQAYGNVARWDVGGGIVFDSSPESEWEEALTKARPLEALGVTLG